MPLSKDLYIYKTEEFIPIERGELVLILNQISSICLACFSHSDVSDLSPVLFHPQANSNYFYSPIIRLRDPEVYGPTKTPVSKDVAFPNVREAYVGLDEIIGFLEYDDDLKVHIDWIKDLKPPYKQQLEDFYEENMAERIASLKPRKLDRRSMTITIQYH